MRIVVNGQQAFGKSVFDALLERGEQVVAVYCAAEKPGQRPDPLKQAAVEKGLPIYQPKSFRKPEVWEEFKTLSPDLVVMAYVTLFVPEEFLNIPTHGTIQYHPSLLPEHRGPSSINWPIIQGKTRTGLTIFWPDNGLDTGPVLLQKEVEISESDTLGSVYFDRLFPMGVEAMLEAVDLVKAGNAPRIAQDDSKSTYESWCKAEDVGVDWNKSTAEIHNLIRGADPQPGAWTTLAGKKVQLYDSARGAPADGQPGAVTSVEEAGLSVATGDGTVVVARVRPRDGKKMGASEFAQQAGVSVGTQLGG